MADKLGIYITKLMTTIVDKEQTDFVKDLAYSELNRLNTDINQFLKSQEAAVKETPQEKQGCGGKCSNKCKNKQEKQLLQEDKNV